MEDGPKKAALAMLLFGKSGKELIPILNLGAEGIAEMNKRTEEYGGVSEDANAKGVALAESINESKLAFDGVNNVLTSALAPVLKTIVDSLNTVVVAFIKSYKEGGFVAIAFRAITTAVEEVGAVVNYLAGVFSALWDAVSDVVSAIVSDISDAFGVKTPDYFDTSKIALILFKDAFIILKDEAVIVINVIKGLLIGLIDVLALVGKIAWDAFNMNWGAIAADWQSGLNTLKSHALKTANEIKESYADLATTVSNALQGKGPAVKEGGIPELKEGTGDGPELGATHKAKKAPKGKDELVANLEAALTAKKLAWSKEQDAQGTAIAFSLQAESDYWNKILARTDLSAKDRAAIETKYLAVHSQMTKERIAIVIDGYKQEIAEADKNATAKLEIAQRELAYIGKAYGFESKEYAQAQAEIVRIKKEAAQQISALDDIRDKAIDKANLDRIAAEETSAKQRVALGVEANQQLLTEQKSFETRRYAIELAAAQRALAAADPNRDPVKAKQLDVQLEQIERDHQTKMTAIDQQAALARSKLAHQIYGPFAQEIGHMISLHQGLFTTLGNMWKGFGNLVDQVITRWTQNFLVGLATQGFAAEKAHLTQVVHLAKQAAANAYNAVVGIPVVGPFLAPPAAAVAFAGVMAFSAEGGMDNVPYDNAPFLLHKNEMVLPASLANPFRSMLQSPAANNNTPSAANDSGGDQHFHYHDTTGKMTPTMIMENRHALAKAMKQAYREGAPLPR
jgi:hypothetical protein